MQSALIIGGDSTIGRAAFTRLEADGIKVSATSRRNGPFKLDLAESPEKWPELPQADTAYLCAAITGLDACENDPIGTRRVNIIHLQMLTERLLARGMQVVFLSTNQVFDGRIPYRKASDAPCPVNEYGRQKAEFERRLLQSKNTAVLRLTKVIAGRLPLLAKWEAALKENKAVEAFGDLVFAPLPVEHAAEGLALLGRQRPDGIFQLSGARDVSYYELALALADKLGIDTSLVVRTNAMEGGIKPQFLPKHGTLEPSGMFAHLPKEEALKTLL